MNDVFSPHHILADLIMSLQISMQDGGLWDTEQPTPQELQSVEPFCIDTMSFEQWLRFVMIERFKMMIECGATLPANCNIAPMAEEALKNKPSKEVSNIVKCLQKIDQHLSGV